MDESDVLSKALTRWASKMATGLRLQAEAYEALISTLESSDPFQMEPASELALSERPARQALLLAAVQERARILRSPSIPRSEWLTLAGRFGYDPRGTAGFFRRSSDGSPGLLTMDAHADVVRLAEAGLRRLTEQRKAIDDSRDEITRAVLTL